MFIFKSKLYPASRGSLVLCNHRSAHQELPKSCLFCVFLYIDINCYIFFRLSISLICQYIDVVVIDDSPMNLVCLVEDTRDICYREQQHIDGSMMVLLMIGQHWLAGGVVPNWLMREKPISLNGNFVTGCFEDCRFQHTQRRLGCHHDSLIVSM